MQKNYDIVIVGGGPVGLSLALTLVRFAPGIRVAIVDRRDFATPRDARASAISAGVRRVFEALGVWPQMAALAQPIRAMKITDSGKGDIARPLFLSFAGDVAQGEPFAHMVPNPEMHEALLGALVGQVELIGSAEISGLVPGPGAAGLNLSDGRTLSAPLIVAADGQNSALRQMSGIGTVSHDYRQSGIVTTIEHELDHEGIAYEHFRPAGPFASLPLPGRRSSLVWCEDRAEVPRYLAMDEDQAALAIEAVMGSTLARVTLLGPLQAFPLKMQIARDFIAPRLALIGDAAHVIHPIAGQGLNLGLQDVAALGEVVIAALRLGLDPGAPDVLDRYQRWRRFDTSLMAMLTDGMNRLFSNDIAPVRALRDIGLGMVDRLPTLKDALIGRAAGISRSGPRLLQGAPI